MCPSENGTLFLLGTDRLGRDMLSRILYGTRISLTVGLIGITISFVLGIVIGGIAGYYGGWIDNITQRFIEVLRSFPELPLWMALSAALPVTWSPHPDLFRDHADPGTAGLDRSRPRRALQTAGPAGGGLLHRRPTDGRQPATHHRPPPAAQLHEPPDRVRDPVDPRHDPGRDGAVVPGPWAFARRSQAGAFC